MQSLDFGTRFARGSPKAFPRPAGFFDLTRNEGRLKQFRHESAAHAIAATPPVSLDLLVQALSELLPIFFSWRQCACRSSSGTP